MRDSEVLIEPRLSESAVYEQERRNKVTFVVDMRANKFQIKNAVERLYGVKVKSVRTSIFRGKLKRRGSSIGQQSNWKKAVVALAGNDRIDFFAAE